MKLTHIERREKRYHNARLKRQKRHRKPDFDRLPDPELANYDVTPQGAVLLSGAAALRFALMVGTVSPDEVRHGR